MLVKDEIREARKCAKVEKSEFSFTYLIKNTNQENALLKEKRHSLHLCAPTLLGLDRTQVGKKSPIFSIVLAFNSSCQGNTFVSWSHDLVMLFVSGWL